MGPWHDVCKTHNLRPSCCKYTHVHGADTVFVCQIDAVALHEPFGVVACHEWIATMSRRAQVFENK
jgi:hypothetical protein